MLVATAHPAKFNEIVEPLVGREIPVPPALARLLSLPRQEEDLEPTLDALRARLSLRQGVAGRLGLAAAQVKHAPTGHHKDTKTQSHEDQN